MVCCVGAQEPDGGGRDRERAVLCCASVCRAVCGTGAGEAPHREGEEIQCRELPLASALPAPCISASAAADSCAVLLGLFRSQLCLPVRLHAHLFLIVLVRRSECRV